MELYMMNRQHGRMILESIENGPLLWPTIEENGVTRPKKYSELSATEAIQADCDVKVTNIILQVLPPEVYALVSNHKVAKELWERIQLLMQGTSLTKQERECKLYDEFAKFAYKKEESLREFYLRFSMLLNDMNIYNMKLEYFQVNKKFLNTLPFEWSKFVIDVKLVRDLHTKIVDQLHAYLRQHEFHANEYGSHTQSSTPLSCTYLPNDFQSSVHHNVYNPSSSIPQVEYAPSVNQQSDFSRPDSGLIVPVFKKGDDPIDAINHIMSFLTAVIALMANLSHSGSDDLAEVHNKDNVTHNVINQDVQLEPKLYDGSVIQKTNAIVIRDSEETLMLAEESRSKMLLKQKDPISKEPNLSTRPTQVEVPKELPKAIEQHRIESKGFQVKMNEVLNENERLLEQAIRKDIVNIVVTSTVNNACEPMHECERCVKLETELQKDFSQEKDIIIKKLKQRIKSLSGNMKEEKIKRELEEIETINIELDHRVTKLIVENDHLKQT
nr:hypothetical protein [Tanacetum cinerariifolium]